MKIQDFIMKNCHSKILPTIIRDDIGENYYQNNITTQMDDKIIGDVKLDFKHFLYRVNTDTFHIKYRGNVVGEIKLQNEIIKSIELYDNYFTKDLYESGFEFMMEFLGAKLSYY